MKSDHADVALARAVATDAARVLVDLRAAHAAGPAAGTQGAGAADGGDPARALRDAADAAAHRVIADRLAAERPDDVVFSEEAPDPRRRLAARRVWIVDPLDGTREFGEPGRVDWAVHIALWEDGALVAGAVALPALGEVYVTHDGSTPVRGASAGDAPAPGAARGDDGSPRIVVSRSRPPAVAAALAADLGARLVPLGSAGAKAAAVWRGEAEAYVHAGGLHEWDAAAPAVVALAAGLHVSRLDGSPVAFNRPDAYVPDLLVCLPELAEPVLAWTARHSAEVIHR